MTVKAGKETVTLKIDGVEVTVEKGKKVYEAATEAGIYLPGLCFDPKMTRFGGCRMCVVDVVSRGRARAKWACCEPAANGVEVITDSDGIRKKRQIMMEFLLMHHPLDCPTCNASGDCGLQDAAYYVKQKKGRLPQERHEEPLHIDNPVLERDFPKCILCGKCVIVCQEVQGNGAIDFQKRGFVSEVGTPMRIPLECDFCGQCLDVCPTGSFQDHTENYKGHDWEYDKTVTTCPYCAVGCTLVVNTKAGDIAKISTDASQGVNTGNLCARGHFGHQAFRSDTRIDAPLIKKDSSLNPVSWDLAIAEITGRLKDIVEKNGPDSVAVIAGEALSNEDAFVLQKYAREVIGTGRINTLSNMAQPGLNAELFDLFGAAAPLARYENIEEAGAFFFFGCDAEKENPVIANMVRMAMRDNKAPLYVANSRDTLFLPMEKARVRYSYTEAASLADALAKAAGGASASDSAGVAGADINAIAEGLKNADNPVILMGAEVYDHPAGVEIAKGIANLAEAAGGKALLFRENCNSQGVNDMGLSPSRAPGYEKAPNVQDGDLFGAMKSGKVKAAIVAGCDPVTFARDAGLAAEALGSLDFLFVTGSHKNETTVMADIVAPALAAVERDGTYTSNEGRVAIFRKALPAKDDAKAEWEIFSLLAQAAGDKGFAYANSAAVTAQIAETVNGYKGLTVSALEWGDGFASYSEVNKGALAVDTAAVAAPGDGLVALITNSLYHLGSLTRQSEALNKIESKASIDLSFEDASSAGLAEGDTAVVTSGRGSINAVVKVSGKSPKGLALVTKNFETNPAMRLVDASSPVTRVTVAKA